MRAIIVGKGTVKEILRMQEKLTEKEKLQNGMWYDANFDPELIKERQIADSLCFAFNSTPPQEESKRSEILQKLLGSLGQNVTILANFFCDYGYNISIGDGSFINHNAYLMDCAPITLGKCCFIGPNCGMYTAAHPLIAKERNQGFEKAKGIVLEDNVWLGGNVVILPGVRIGEGAVIGAGAVVTRDIAPFSIAVGNPARVIRKISDKDSIKEFLI